MPAPLAKHSGHSADLALYLEGTGNGRMVEEWQGNTLIESILPLFDSHPVPRFLWPAFFSPNRETFK